MSNPKVVVVVGGLGFLGQHVVRKLLARTGEKQIQEVRIFDLSQQQQVPDGRVVSIPGDLRNPAEVSIALKGADAVIHCASASPFSKDEHFLTEVNVKGTENVINACLEHGITRLVYTSSASVVYDGTDQMGVDESVPYPSRFRDAYAKSKAEAERRVLHANGRVGTQSTAAPLLTCSIRPHGIFGEGDPSLVPITTKQARAGKMKFIIGDGKNLVDFTYVGNVADAHILALDALAPGAAPAGQAYFITNDEPVPFWTFLGDILVGLGYERPYIRLPYLLMYCIFWLVDLIVWLLSPLVALHPVMTLSKVQIAGTYHYYSTGRARRDLNYHPRVSLADGLSRTLTHFKGLRNPKLGPT